MNLKDQPFTKKQHYIPQFYLRNFSQDKEHIHVYDKKIGDKGDFRYQTIIKVAHENNFYTYRTKKGAKENLEDFFCQFEGDAAAIINKVRKEHTIDAIEKEKLALFVAFIYSRTPAFKARTEEMHSKMGEKISRMMFQVTPKEWLRKFYKEKEGKNFTDKEIKNLVDFATNSKRSKIKFTYPNEYWIKIMLNMGVEVAPIFYGMDWFIFYTKQSYAFITSDNPFLLIPPENYDRFWGVGLLTHKARKVVPLTSDMCLVMGDVSDKPVVKFGEANKDFFRQINKYLILASNRFCFSPEKGKLEKLVKELKPYNVPRLDKIEVS